ncbi:MAG: hypothetical protein KatS3mg061_1511 [Dehalococcoidia bacterium]|nr:MAG: hypothetical protein KatS3mg061_1511 [Dehalococcoidia bacterium]
MENIRVLLVDAQAIYRQGLRSVISQEPDIEIVGESGDGLEALDLVEHLQPDVVVADVRLPGLEGLELARKVRMATRSIAFILLSGAGDDEEMLFQAIRAGGGGVLQQGRRPERAAAGHPAGGSGRVPDQ